MMIVEAAWYKKILMVTEKFCLKETADDAR